MPRTYGLAVVIPGGTIACQPLPDESSTLLSNPSRSSSPRQLSGSLSPGHRCLHTSVSDRARLKTEMPSKLPKRHISVSA
jgi:hypothetical protein